MFSNNSSKPSEFFKSKEKYDEVFPVVPEDKIYDLWYKRPYFGKVNTKGVTVYPKEEFLAALDGIGDFKALNFVVDAFLDLQGFIRRSKDRKVFPPDFFDRFFPKRAWTPLPVEYDNYFESFIFDPFLNVYLPSKKVYSFDSFVREYLRFIRTVSPDVSITQNEYIMSNNCTNKISGLIIDLAFDDHGDTELKVKSYLEKFEYSSFINPCRNFGFRVNKNAPWQLIADITSPEMAGYIARHNPTIHHTSELFDTNFYTASEIDYENFKRYLYILYTSHYSVNSSYEKVKVTVKSVKYGSPIFSDYKTTLIKELPAEVVPKTYSLFEEKYGEEYFLKLYFRIRLIENSKENRYNDLVTNVQDYYNIGGKKRALDYIDLKLINSRIYKEGDQEPFFFVDK